MSRLLQIRNRQRRRLIDARFLKAMLGEALAHELDVNAYEVCVHLVGATEMTRLNETFLQHAGSTDVITFNHREIPNETELHGELFVCVDEAMARAPEFKSTWQAEILRYAVHGCLHLQGHDDHEPNDRRRMKREENRVLRALGKRFAVARIARNMRADHE